MKYLIFFLLTLHLIASEDEKLVLLAYDSGLKPVPESFENLLYRLNESAGVLTKEKIKLGRRLFFDKDLSLNRDISCASCHSFTKGGADGRPTAIGHLNRANPLHLNTPTVLNTAFSKKLFWDGRSDTLQEQAKGPLQAPFEMSMTPGLAIQRVRENRDYAKLFRDAYGKDGIGLDDIADAISSYEKVLLTRGRYDDFLLGYFDALSSKEKEGLKLFITKGCIGCHNGVGLGGQVLRKFPLSYHPVWSMGTPAKIDALRSRYRRLLSGLDALEFEDDTSRSRYLESVLGAEDLDLLENGFFDQINEEERLKSMTSTGCLKCHIEDSDHVKSDLAGKVAYPFENKGGFLGAQNSTKYFRVPLLRNIVRTSPYFHNGGVGKLEDAVKIMGIHQVRRRLSDEEVEKITGFLKAVDGPLTDYGDLSVPDMQAASF